jgi:hypothetical protein
VTDETDETAEPTPFGKHLLDLIVEGVARTRERTLPHEHRAKWAATTEFAEALETEMTPLMRELFAHHLDDPTLPDAERTMFEMLVNPEHQYGVLADIGALISAILTAVFKIGQPPLQAYMNGLWASFPDMPMSPADAADGVMRNILDEATGVQYASWSGVNKTVFDYLVRLTGEPPGPIDMLSLWRRGLMEEDFLDYTIRYSRIRDEFLPYVKLLAHSWMSPTDAVELAIKQIVSNDEAKQYFVTAGGLEDQWDILYQAAGNSVGAQQAMQLWNHQLIDEAQVDEVLGRTRINPMFYDIAKLLRHKWFGPIQIGAAIKSGVITPDEGAQWLVADGYEPAQAQAFAAGEAAAKTTKAKVDTEAMVVSQYIDHLFTATEAIAALAQLGYSAEEADLIVSNADAKRALSQTTTAVTAIRHAFMTGRVDALAASGDLDKLEIPAMARDEWLKAWTIEKSVATRELTTAQVGDMLKKSILTEGEAEGRWKAMGWDAADAKLLGYYYTGTTPPK